MTRDAAIDRIMGDLGYGDTLRYFVKHRVAEMTGYAASLDLLTVRAIEDALRREVAGL